MKALCLILLLALMACKQKSDKPQSEVPVQNPVQERSDYSATILAKVEIRQGEIEFLENAFNEDRGNEGSCFVEVYSGQVQKFKLFEDELQITSSNVTQAYQRKSGRRFSIYGKWEHTQAQSKLTITSTLLIKEDHSIELTNNCQINRVLN